VDNVCDVCGGRIIHRDDDKPKIIKERLKSYREDTIPVLHYYRRLRALRALTDLAILKKWGSGRLKLFWKAIKD